jgi:isopentenyl diphosphate isomerase/L-lactate dehydrogenase-like FMN-dependent dehydrogenase
MKVEDLLKPFPIKEFHPFLRAVMAGGQPGVENVLDIIRSGIDSAMLGLGRSSVQDLSPADLVIPDGFRRDLGA